jgi:hypothetical protein
MSTIRMLARPVAVLAILAASVPAIGTLFATPAAAFGFRLQGGGGAPMFARRLMAPSAALSANRSTVPLNQSHRVPSTAQVSTTTAAVRAVRANALASALADTKSGASRTTPVRGSACKRGCLRSHVTRIATGDAQPGGSALPGGNGVAGGVRMGTTGGGGPSGGGPVASPSLGSGPGQFTTADTPASTSGGGTRSLNYLGSNRAPGGGVGTTSGQATPNATSKGGTAVPNTRTTTLRAVTECMTSAGSCPMERDVGTACQCKDMQGHVYDGIVK